MWHGDYVDSFQKDMKTGIMSLKIYKLKLKKEYIERCQVKLKR